MTHIHTNTATSAPIRWGVGPLFSAIYFGIMVFFNRMKAAFTLIFVFDDHDQWPDNPCDCDCFFIKMKIDAAFGK
jgi:hypothetical protein